MSDSQYIDRKSVDDSYRPRSGTMSPGLMRAREPYRVKNAITGIALGAFAVGIWAYSLSAVRQDVFDDVDEEARAMQSAGTKHVAAVADSGLSTVVSGNTTPVASRITPPPRGLLRYLDARFPRLLDPERKTFVYGAPPVDNVGKIGV